MISQVCPKAHVSKPYNTRLRAANMDKDGDSESVGEQQETSSTCTGVTQDLLTQMLQWIQQWEERMSEEDRAREERLQQEN